MKDRVSFRFLWLAGFTVLTILLFYPLLRPFGFHSVFHPYYSYIPFIPFISLGLLFIRRHVIFSDRSEGNNLGSIVAAAGIILSVLGYIDYLPFTSTATAILLSGAGVILWSGLFILSFGFKTYGKAALPAVLLLFTIPLPDRWLQAIIHNLQSGSAAVLAVMLKVMDIPFLQDGTSFHFSNVSIRIADICSGIRSSLALVLVTVILSVFYLDKWWQRLALFTCIYPIILLKNGLRILSIALLGEYLDLSFITGGFIHKSGGFIFFGISVFLILVIMRLLTRTSLTVRINC